MSQIDFDAVNGTFSVRDLRLAASVCELLDQTRGGMSEQHRDDISISICFSPEIIGQAIAAAMTPSTLFTHLLMVTIPTDQDGHANPGVYYYYFHV